jgi:hypothetical protein
MTSLQTWRFFSATTAGVSGTTPFPRCWSGTHTNALSSPAQCGRSVRLRPAEAAERRWVHGHQSSQHARLPWPLPAHLPPGSPAHTSCTPPFGPPAKLPVMEITFLLQKTVAEPGRRIDFHSVWGMPLHGAARRRHAARGLRVPARRRRLPPSTARGGRVAGRAGLSNPCTPNRDAAG